MQELLALVEGSENLAAKVHQSLVEDQPQKFLAHPALLVAKGQVASQLQGLPEKVRRHLSLEEVEAKRSASEALHWLQPSVLPFVAASFPFEPSAKRIAPALLPTQNYTWEPQAPQFQGQLLQLLQALQVSSQAPL